MTLRTSTYQDSTGDYLNPGFVAASANTLYGTTCLLAAMFDAGTVFRITTGWVGGFAVRIFTVRFYKRAKPVERD